MLWPQDMPADRTLVMVSKNDDLVPGELVKKQLQQSGPGVTFWEHPTAGKPRSQCVRYSLASTWKGMVASGASMLPYAFSSWLLCACLHVSAHVSQVILVQAMAVYSWTMSGNIASFKRLHGSQTQPATRKNE